MFGRFCRLSRLIVIFTFALTFFVFVQILKLFLSKNDDGNIVSCQMSKEKLHNLLDLAEKTNLILETFNITNFLCYGTLWGALRISKIFPWKNNFDFCVLNEDIVRLDEVFFRRQFSKHSLIIEYDSANGVYTVSNDKNDLKNGYLNLFLFEIDPSLKLVRRIGFKHRLLPPTSDNIGSFPSRLIQKPFKNVKLNDKIFPAPRDGIEIQKYHYKDNWWTEIKPNACVTSLKL